MPDYINGQLIGLGEFPFDVLAVVRDTLPAVGTFPPNSAALRLSDHSFHEILMRTIPSVPAVAAVFTDEINTVHAALLRWRNIHTQDPPASFSQANDVIYNTTLRRFRRFDGSSWSSVIIQEIIGDAGAQWLGNDGLENSQDVVSRDTALAFMDMYLADAVADGTQDPTRLNYFEGASSPVDGSLMTSDWDYPNSGNLDVALLTSAIMPSYRGSHQTDEDAGDPTVLHQWFYNKTVGGIRWAVPGLVPNTFIWHDEQDVTLPSEDIFGASYWRWAGGSNPYHPGYVHKSNVQAVYERVAQNLANKDTFLIFFDRDIDDMHYVRGYMGRYRPTGSTITSAILGTLRDADDNVLLSWEPTLATAPAPISLIQFLYVYDTGTWYSGVDDGGTMVWQARTNNDTGLAAMLTSVGSTIRWIGGNDLFANPVGNFPNQGDVLELFENRDLIFDSNSHYFFFSSLLGEFIEVTGFDDTSSSYVPGQFSTQTLNRLGATYVGDPAFVATVADLPAAIDDNQEERIYVVADNTWYRSRRLEPTAGVFENRWINGAGSSNNFLFLGLSRLRWININAGGNQVMDGGNYANEAAVQALYDAGTITYDSNARDVYYDESEGELRTVTAYRAISGTVLVDYSELREEFPYVGSFPNDTVPTTYSTGSFYVRSDTRQVLQLVESPSIEYVRRTSTSDLTGDLNVAILWTTANIMRSAVSDVAITTLITDGTIVYDTTKTYLYWNSTDSKVRAFRMNRDHRFSNGGISVSFFTAADNANYVGTYLTTELPDAGNFEVGDWIWNSTEHELQGILSVGGVWDTIPGSSVISTTGHDFLSSAIHRVDVEALFVDGLFIVAENIAYYDSTFRHLMKVVGYENNTERRATFYGYYENSVDCPLPPVVPRLEEGLWFYDSDGVDQGIKRIREVLGVIEFASLDPTSVLSGFTWVHGMDPSGGAFSLVNLHTAFDLMEVTLDTSVPIVFYDLGVTKFKQVDAHEASDLGEIKHVTAYRRSISAVSSYLESYWSSFSLGGVGTEDEVRALLSFTASEQADLLTGASIDANDRLVYTREGSSDVEVDLPSALAGLIADISFDETTLDFTIVWRDGRVNTVIPLDSLDVPDEYTYVLALEVTQTGNAVSLSPTPAHTVLEPGHVYGFVTKAANTGAVTVAISSLTATELLRTDGSSLENGELPIGHLVRFTVNDDGDLISYVRPPLIVTRAQILAHLGLTEAEADTLLVDAAKAGSVVTITKNDGTTVTITEGGGGGGGTPSDPTEAQVRNAIGFTAGEQASVFVGSTFSDVTRQLTLNQEGGGTVVVTIPDRSIRHIDLDGETLRFYTLLTTDPGFDANTPSNSIDLSGLIPEDDVIFVGAMEITYVGNALSFTPTIPMIAYDVSDVILFVLPTAFVNTGAVSINVSGLGAQSVQKANGTLFLAGELSGADGYYIRAVYDGTEWVTDVRLSEVTRSTIYPIVRDIFSGELPHITLNEDDVGEGIQVRGTPANEHPTLSGELQRSERLIFTGPSESIIGPARTVPFSARALDPLQVSLGTGAANMISIDPNDATRFIVAKAGNYGIRMEGTINATNDRAYPEIEVFPYAADAAVVDAIGFIEGNYHRDDGNNLPLRGVGSLIIPEDNYAIKIMGYNLDVGAAGPNAFVFNDGFSVTFLRFSETGVPNFYDYEVLKTLVGFGVEPTATSMGINITGGTRRFRIRLPQPAGNTDGLPNNFVSKIRVGTKIALENMDGSSLWEGRVVNRWNRSFLEVEFPTETSTGIFLAGMTIIFRIGYSPSKSETLTESHDIPVGEIDDGIIYIKQQEGGAIEQIRVKTRVDDPYFNLIPITLGTGVLGYATSSALDGVDTAGGTIGSTTFAAFLEKEIAAGSVYQWVVLIQDTQAGEFLDNTAIYLQFNDDERVLKLDHDVLNSPPSHRLYVGYAYGDVRLVSGTGQPIAVFTEAGVSAETASSSREVFDAFVLKKGRLPQTVVYYHQGAPIDGLSYTSAALYPGDTNGAVSRRNLYQDRKFLIGDVLYSTNQNKPLDGKLVFPSGARGDVDVHQGETAGGNLLKRLVVQPSAGVWEFNVEMLFGVGTTTVGLDIGLFEVFSGTDESRLVTAETAGQTKGSYLFSADENTVHGKLLTRPIITDGSMVYYVLFGLTKPNENVLDTDEQAFTAWRGVNMFWGFKLIEE